MTRLWNAFVLANATVSLVVVVGLLASGMTSERRAARIDVPEAYVWVRAEADPTDAYSDDGAGQSGDAMGAADETTTHPAIRLASQRLAAGRVESAIEVLERAVVGDPEHPGLHNALGTALLKVDRVDEAVEALERAVALRGSVVRDPYNLGTAQLRRGANAEAVVAFDKALEINPFHAESRFNKALAFARGGDAAAAEREYAAIAEGDRGRVGTRALFNLGVVQLQAERLDEALETFLAVLRRDAEHIEARFNRALLFSRIGSNDQAIEQYRRLLDLRPDHLRGRLNLAALYMKAEDCGSAAVHLRDLVARVPDYASAHYNLGLCELRGNRPGDAIPHLLRATSIDRAMGPAHFNLALALSRTGDTEGALEHYGEAARAEPGVARYHYNHAVLLAQADRVEEAISAYQAALRADPLYFEAKYNLGLAHYRSDNFEAARAVFAAALAHRPDSYEAAYNLGLTLLKLQQELQAEKMFRTALALEETPSAHYNLGLSLMRQGLHAEANESYLAALRIEPKHARSIERLAESFVELGEHDLALSRLDQLGKIAPDDPTALNTGIGLLRSGEAVQAERYLALALEYRETVSGAYNLGLSRARQGRHREAISAYDRALEQEPEHARALERLAESAIELGEHERALPTLERLVRVAPRDPTGINAGIRLLRAEDFATAARYFEVATGGAPRLRARSFELLGRARIRIDPALAERGLEEAAAEFPDHEGIADQLRRARSAVARAAAQERAAIAN